MFPRHFPLRFPAVRTTLCLSGVVVALAVRPALAQVYQVTNLGVAPGANISHGQGLNDVGGIVGDSNPSGVASATVWQNGVVQSLAALTGSSTAHDINNAAQIVGTGQGPGNGGFLIQNGGVTFLAALPGATGPGALTNAHNINNVGVIAGDSVSPSGLRAVLWDNGSAPLNLGVLPGASESAARDVNDAGQATGYSGQSAFFWQNSVMNDIGRLTGSNNAIGEAINSQGHIVGYSVFTFPSTFSRAFVWRNGIMTPLGELPGAQSSNAWSINDTGQIVGQSGAQAVLWQNSTIFNLNNLIPANSGWVLQNATAINNHGHIVGTGSFNGQTRAFLLTLAAPEPTPLLLLAPFVAVGGLVLVRRRSRCVA
jgi:probable HAF family extracellular repeat protein